MAFKIQNLHHNLNISTELGFQIRFASNSVTVSVNGKIHLNFQNEVYVIDKPLPDMVIKNTILGKKYVVWTGKTTISSPNTGYFSELNCDHSSTCINIVEGQVLLMNSVDRTVLPKTTYLYGSLGGAIYQTHNDPRTHHSSTSNSHSNGNSGTTANSGGYFGYGLNYIKSFFLL